MQTEKLLKSLEEEDEIGVRVAILSDVDVNAQNEEGLSALHYFAMTRDKFFMKYTLEKGAAVDIKDRYGRTPLYRCITHHFCEGIRILLDHGAEIVADENGNTLAHVAAEKGRFETLKTLHSAGISLSATNKMGDTALHVLCKRKHHSEDTLESLKFLVSHGLSMTDKNHLGYTAVDFLKKTVKGIDNHYVKSSFEDVILGSSVYLADEIDSAIKF